VLQPQPYVGIDLHRRRSVIVQRSAQGETLSATQVTNDDVVAFAKAVSAAGEHPEVVIEACYGWYWAVDLLEELGCRVHLAHPLGNNWGNRRVKNDLLTELPVDDHVIPDGVDHRIPDLVLSVMVPSITSFRQL
jgi:hypothetical protein